MHGIEVMSARQPFDVVFGEIGLDHAIRLELRTNRRLQAREQRWTAKRLVVHDQIDRFHRPGMADHRGRSDFVARCVERPDDQAQVALLRDHVSDAIGACRIGHRLAKGNVAAQLLLERPHAGARRRGPIPAKQASLHQPCLARLHFDGLVDERRRARIDDAGDGDVVLGLEAPNGQQRRRAEQARRVGDLQVELAQLGLQQRDVVAAHVEGEISALEIHGCGLRRCDQALLIKMPCDRCIGRRHRWCRFVLATQVASDHRLIWFWNISLSSAN